MEHLPDVCTYTDFRDNMPSHFRRLRGVRRATLVTQKGKAAAVVLSPAAYERLVMEADVARSSERVARALREFAAGKGIEGRAAYKMVRARIAAKGGARGRRAG